MFGGQHPEDALRGGALLGLLLDGQNALGVALGFVLRPLRDLGGDEAGLRQGGHGRQLHFEPGGEFVFL